MASKAAAAKTPAASAAPSIAVVKRDSKANNYIAAVAVIVVLIVLVCGFIAKSLIGSIILDGKLIIYTNQARSDLDTKLQNIPQLTGNYNQLGNKQQLIADALPSSADFPALISIAQAMSADAGLTLKSVSQDSSSSSTTPAAATSTSTTPAAPGSSTSTPTTAAPVPYVFDVNISGTYSQVVQFFKDVELSARPMKVVNTQFSGDGSALQVAVQIQTYYQGPATINDQTETLK